MVRKGRPVVIVSYARTPIGSFLGGLSTIPAPRLGGHVVKEVVKRAGIDANEVHECIMGEVIQAGTGQAPARQAALFGGLPESVECLTINKVCGSGLKAVMLASQAIELEDADVAVAGGMENMSLAPYLLKKVRTGYRLGHGELLDAMILDGLWDVYNDIHMGSCAEYCVREYNLTREEQDEFAAESYRRALRAQENGWFEEEIVPVEVHGRKGQVTIVREDEEPKRVDFEKMKKLRPVFEKDGTITAANASKINDGAAAVLIMAEDVARKKGLTPVARIVDYCSAARKPIEFPFAPVNAMKKLFHRTGMKPEDIDIYEINEAFASVTLTAIKEFNIDPNRVNVHGGAVALGHPIGASGARLLCTLLSALKIHKKRYGLVSLCIGGGEAVAMIIENLTL